MLEKKRKWEDEKLNSCLVLILYYVTQKAYHFSSYNSGQQILTYRRIRIGGSNFQVYV